MNNAISQFVTVLTAIVGLAIVAVLVSKNAQTPQVFSSFWGGFSNAIGAATGPVTGGGGSNSQFGVTLPSVSFGG